MLITLQYLCLQNVLPAMSMCSEVLWLSALLAFNLGHDVPCSDPVLQITCTDSHISYNLRGVVYFSNEYFAACMMTNTGTVQFHNGMLTGSSFVYESHDLATFCTDRLRQSNLGYLCVWHSYFPLNLRELGFAMQCISLHSASSRFGESFETPNTW